MFNAPRILALFAFTILLNFNEIQKGGPATTKPASSPNLDEKLDDYLKKTDTWLSRRQIEYYGQPKTKLWPSKDTIDAAIKLYQERKAAGAIKPGSKRDRFFCFNLLLQDPPTGREYYEALIATPAVNGAQLLDLLFPELVVSEEWGEQRALRGAKDTDVSRRRSWARYLSNFAIYTNSRAPIEAWIANEKDDETAAFLMKALANLADPASAPFVKKQFETTKNDERRAAALFAMVEFGGYNFIPTLEKLKTDGPKTTAELKEALEYLKSGTSKEQPHGFSVVNDPEFLLRFADLYSCPAIMWLKLRNRLDEAAVEKAEPIAKDDKDSLFDVLEESLTFGLPLVKGSLFKSLAPEDMQRLLKLRALSFYRPTEFSQGHFKTINIMIRSLRLH